MYPPRLYLRDPWIWLPLSLATVTQVALWVYTLSKIHPTDDQLFLHYTIIFGVDLIGEWWKLLYPPIIGVGVILANFLLAFFLYGSQRFLSRLLAVVALLFEVFLAIAMFLIINLNI